MADGASLVLLLKKSLILSRLEPIYVLESKLLGFVNASAHLAVFFQRPLLFTLLGVSCSPARFSLKTYTYHLLFSALWGISFKGYVLCTTAVFTLTEVLAVISLRTFVDGTDITYHSCLLSY